MTQEERNTAIKILNDVFRFLEDLADKEMQNIKLYNKARVIIDDEDPLILKWEQKMLVLRGKAEKIQGVLDILLNEE